MFRWCDRRDREIPPLAGIVLKHHAFLKKGKVVVTKLKLVTDLFKERHIVKQSKVEQSADDFLTIVGKSFATTARYQKAYQHLVERDSKIDMGKLIQELNQDFEKEYKEEAKELLYVEFSPLLKKIRTRRVNRMV